MPGCGKSTVGVILAKSMGFNFVDTDILISQKAEKPLQNIIDNEGIRKFLSLEEEVGSKLKIENYVIATGGSMVLSKKAMENLKALGTVVYIKVPVDELEARLINFKTRGIVRNPDETLQDIYNTRTPLYEQYADIIVENQHSSILEETVNQIVDSLKGYKIKEN